MLIRIRQHQSIRRKFVRFTASITTAIFVVFLIYSQSCIDAFSLGRRTLPTTQLNNREVSKDLSLNAVIRVRKPLSPFPLLQAKGSNDDDERISILNIDAYDSTGHDGNDDNSGSDSSAPFFAKRFQMVDNVPPVLKQQSSWQQVNENESDEDMKAVDTQIITKLCVGDRLSVTPEFTSDVEEKSTNIHTDRPISLLKRAKNEDLYEFINPFQALVYEMPETFDNTIEKSQQILKDIQDIPNKMNESVRETKQTVEETIEKTQQSLKDLQDIPKKIKQTLLDTKGSISKKQKSVRDAVSSVKVLLGLERPSLRSRWYRKIPMTPKEDALDLVGKAAKGTFKLALWIGKGVGSLAWKGSRSFYNNSVGPVVEEVWNEQLDSLNSSINTASTFVKNSPTRVTSAVSTSIQRDPASVSSSTSPKNQPTSIQPSPASVSDTTSAKNPPSTIQQDRTSFSDGASAKNLPTSIQEASASASRSARKINQPAFVSRKKMKLDRKNEHAASNGKSAKPATKIIFKSPAELNKEIEDAQKLADEISNALGVAERAMIMDPNNELDDPMIEIRIEKLKSIGRIERPVPPPSSVVEKKKKKKKKVVPKDVLTRFKRAKTQDDLDAEFLEARSLVKEIANALEKAERTLMMASTSSDSNLTE